jgi:predicted AAA+ superfamily ATPase
MEVIGRLFNPPASSFFLFGPRGTGKSTFAKGFFGDALVVDLLDPERLRALSARPEMLKEMVGGRQGTTTVLIDEIQKIPELLTVVHSLMESMKTVTFVLTGSSARKLKRAGVDLLAGRALLCEMHPFMAVELGKRFRLSAGLRTGTTPRGGEAGNRRRYCAPTPPCI